MGTLRRQKEEQERAERTRVARAEQARYNEIASAIAAAQTRIAGLRADVESKKAELQFLKGSSRPRWQRVPQTSAVLRRLRGADLAREDKTAVGRALTSEEEVGGHP